MKNKIKLISFGIIIGILLSTTIGYAVTLYEAREVSYDNSNSGTTNTDVQGAIDELYNMASTHCPDGYICNKAPKSFSEDSWETIANAIKSGNTSVYNVGDTKEVEVSGYGTFTVRIANMSTPSECNIEGFSGTACGFVVEFVDIITNHAVNSTLTNVGGWRDSEMRTFVNNDIYNALPEDLRSVISDTYVVSGHGDSDSSNFTTTDKLYLLSTKEVWGDRGTNIPMYDTAEAETRQLDYYSNIGVSINKVSGAKKYDSSGSIDFWWLRSVDSRNSKNFVTVYLTGNWNTRNATDTYGVAPAFRLS